MQLNRRSAARLFVGLFTLFTLTFDGSSPAVADTVVRFDTAVGAFDVELFDTVTPITVDNFLNYVDDGDYIDSIVHRSVPGFVIQGGGFKINNGGFLDGTAVPTDPPIANEPFISNTRGTLAMAKFAGDPDSATSQWFINLGDNSANLDFQNGGFSVFGQVLGDGMDIVDAIAALPTVDIGSPFFDLPVLDLDASEGLHRSNLVMINDVSIVPEPSTVVSALLGLTVLLGAVWHKRHKSARPSIVGADRI